MATTKKPAARKTATRAKKTAGHADAEKNKGMAVVAYLLFFIPLLTGDHRRSPFVMFHTNQGTVLFIVNVAVWIAWSILWAILVSMLRFYSIGYILIRAVFSPLISIAMLVFLIIGIINAVNGRMKPLPIIGRFTIIK